MIDRFYKIFDEGEFLSLEGFGIYPPLYLSDIYGFKTPVNTPITFFENKYYKMILSKTTIPLFYFIICSFTHHHFYLPPMRTADKRG